MGLVATWLSGIGLSHAIPSFKAAGIVSPSALAELDLAHYEALGVTEPADRRKLFYLVQRIKMAVDQEDEPSTHQREVDNVLSQTLVSSTKLVLTEDDSLEDSDSVEIVEPPKKEPARRKTGRVTSTRRSMTAAGTEEVKENRRQNLASRSRRASLTNGRTENPARPARSSSKQEDYDDSDDANDDEDSAFSEESSEGADNELQERPATSMPRRTSSRLQQKRMQRDSDTSYDSSQQEEPPPIVAAVTGLTSTVSNIQSSRGKSNGMTAGTNVTRRRSTSSSLDSGDESNNSGPTAQRKSSIPMHRGRRYESKIQNPGTSARTGKQLSTIPSESAAPMSPLVSLPVSRLDAEISKQRQLEEKKAAAAYKSISARPSRTGTTSMGSQSGSDSDSRPTRTRSVSGSDSNSSGCHRSGRQSIGGRQSSGLSRRSLMPQKSTSLRDLVTNELSIDITKGRARRSLPAVANSSTETKGPIFVHGMPEDNSWGAQVARLRADNQAEHELFAGHCLQPDDEQMRIRVIIRKRPMSSNEASTGNEIDVVHPLEYNDYGRVLVYQPKTRVDLTKEIEQIPFAFDNVFDESSSNVQIYERSVRNLVPGVFEGRWASVFAYGQTGSGKTFTMMGSNLTGINAGNATNHEANLGLYYMAAMDVFELASRPEYRHLTVGASLFEIYGGKLFDLLNDRKPVKCLENHRGKVCFPGLSEHPVSNANELMDVIEAGAVNRSTGSTSKNADSSRSHAVLQLSLRKDIGRQQSVEYGRLTFIDLAGSERGADTSKASRATRLEGAEINTSLLALKEVIRALANCDSMAHIPFRGSKLTQVLKESFVGKNSRSVMVACIAPNISNCEHTLNTLRYADRVKERNPETGNLSSNVASISTTKETRRLSRSSSVPVVIESSLAKNSAFINNEEEVESFVSQSQYESEDLQDTESDKEYEAVSVGDSDTDLLDDLLRNTPHQERRAQQSNSRHAQPGSKGSEKSTKSPLGKEQFEALVSTHRAVMSEMLGMVKNEMTLVNKADADRDTIDDYMKELDGLHGRQLSLIHSLEDRLKDYYAAAGSSAGSSTPHDTAFGIMDDDDSFEDLRDD